jgi:hypothetical protein
VVAGRRALHCFLLEREGLDGPIDYLEFGVGEGVSIRWWVEANRHPGSTFVGFDSFDGLPEAWRHLPGGSFSTNGEVPAIADQRCQFVKGFFHDTLPNWLDDREFCRRTVLHLDAVLYTSTLVVLTQLLPRLKPGSILIFDEFEDQLHEYRAFQDATEAYLREFVTVCRSEHWDHVALKAL